MCSVSLDLNLMLGSFKFHLQATIDHHGFLCIVVIIFRLSSVARKRFIAATTNYCVCDMNYSEAPPYKLYFIHCLWGEFLTRTLRKGNDLLPWCWHILSISLDRGRGIGTETCWVDNLFYSDDLWFGSDTNTIQGYPARRALLAGYPRIMQWYMVCF